MKFDPNIPCGSRIMIIFHEMATTGWTDAQQKGCYACQWLDNVDMHMHAKFD